MTLTEFVARWSASTLTEKSAAQQHFLDLCALLHQPTPAQVDPTGASYTFEKSISKTGGGSGFADVWKRGAFAIEYKGKGKNLTDAYKQLLAYREDLENPPILMVCDLNRFEIHTNFTGTIKRVYAFDLEALLANIPTETCARPPLEVLRAMFEAPERLRPSLTTAQVTEQVAADFGKIAQSLSDRLGIKPSPKLEEIAPGEPVAATDAGDLAKLHDSLKERGTSSHLAAHFLIRLLFCVFAEDVGLLPPGLFTKLVENTRTRPAEFTRRIRQLFDAMAHGGSFGIEDIRHFNGGLFNDDTVLDLTDAELQLLYNAAKLDWSSIEPSIFGTLFERGLDPAKRSQLGAHYTSRDDILMIVEPVVMAPLRRRWEAVRQEALTILEKRETLRAEEQQGVPLTAAQRRARAQIAEDLTKLLLAFTDELAQVRVLDPACGSGNFLYVALRQLLDLEKAVIVFATGVCGLSGFFPKVSPEQMRGIEINEYAHELAPITVWIGYIQWLRDNGFSMNSDPILRPFENIVQGDALITVTSSGEVKQTEWPAADFIIGNPPFLGDKKMRSELGDEYVKRLRKEYEGGVAGGADLVCYFFERARAGIAGGTVRRAGLLSTNSIRYGENRRVLDRIKQTGDIFMAWSDRPWVLDGASVRVSVVGFDDGTDTIRTLNGDVVESVNPDLSARPDVTLAHPLPENQGIAFLGMMKAGPFDIDDALAQKMLTAPLNPNGCPNSDVVKRRLGGQDVTGRPRTGWIIDFGATLPEDDASLYEMPFEHVRQHVKPLRDTNNRERMKRLWWLHGEARPGLRKALQGKSRCIVTPEVAKHRVFIWMSTNTIPDHTCHVLARDDDYFFGVIHSRLHELWSLAIGNYMGMGNDPRYNSSRTFGTFPMPWPPGTEPIDDSKVQAIAAAAKRLVELRDNWLNPPGATADDLKKRTLTNLYNARPSWLDNAHRKLDEAVFAAYRWPADLTDDEILARLLALNHERFANQSK